jgi:hypothetical protein
MRHYRFAPALYLEWFDDEALLLVAGRERLLTLNRAAGTLFERLGADFADRTLTLQDGIGWLDAHYQLDVETCRDQARRLLAVALRQQLLLPAARRRKGTL